MSGGPPHRISTSLSLGRARASLHVPRRSSRSLSAGVLKCSRRLRATSQASQSLSVSQTTSSDFPPRSKSANARRLSVPGLDGVMFCVGSWRCVPLSKTASWRVFASCASPLYFSNEALDGPMRTFSMSRIQMVTGGRLRFNGNP
ncbi:hypothetical protein TcCL_NonESM11999 [Trypanosoma cruzi]|nr:hypothetical protein TcCL_NonESM11999 [Trypanosoma cruzi]